jgi:hypothetical protein
MGVEAHQRYLLEVRLDNKTLRRTQFIDGVASASVSYEISTANEQ